MSAWRESIRPLKRSPESPAPIRSAAENRQGLAGVPAGAQMKNREAEDLKQNKGMIPLRACISHAPAALSPKIRVKAAGASGTMSEG